jgi:hypothetical protein
MSSLKFISRPLPTQIEKRQQLYIKVPTPRVSISTRHLLIRSQFFNSFTPSFLGNFPEKRIITLSVKKIIDLTKRDADTRNQF